MAELADELVKAKVETRESYEGWLRDYYTFHYFLANTRRSREVLTRLTRLTTEHLHREGGTVAYSDVLRTAGHNCSRVQCSAKQVQSVMLKQKQAHLKHEP